MQYKLWFLERQCKFITAIINILYVVFPLNKTSVVVRYSFYSVLGNPDMCLFKVLPSTWSTCIKMKCTNEL